MISIEEAHPACQITWAALAEMSVSDVGAEGVLVARGDDLWLATMKSAGPWNRESDPDAIILDLQGMDTMVSASRMHFDDSLTGTILNRFLGRVGSGSTLRRQGVAGAPPELDFPGGEVLVDERLRVGVGGSRGEAWTVAGFMRDEHDQGTGVALVRSGGIARDRRSIYSHTALWPEDGEQAGLITRDLAVSGAVSLLDLVTQLASDSGIRAYATAIRLSPADRPCRAVTRTLRHLPTAPIHDVRDAAELGAERVTEISRGERLVAFGTYYPRIEEEWQRLRSGKAYEARGHFHCAILDTEGKVRHVAHLRDVTAADGARVEIELRPVGNVIKVDPVVILEPGSTIRTHRGAELNVFHSR